MVTVRVVSAQSDGPIEFAHPDFSFMYRLMKAMADTATKPIAFTVQFEDDQDKEPKSRFINPEGGEKDV